MTHRPTTTAAMKYWVLCEYGLKIQCNACHEWTDPAAIEFDHIVALALGGEHDRENLQPLCPDCHKQKTHGAKHAFHTSDRGKINKVKRQEAARLALERGEEKAKKHKPIPSRPLSNSKYKKKLDGTVEERE